MVSTVPATDLAVEAGRYEVEPRVEPVVVIGLRTETGTVTLQATTIHHEEPPAHPSVLVISDGHGNMNDRSEERIGRTDEGVMVAQSGHEVCMV